MGGIKHHFHDKIEKMFRGEEVKEVLFEQRVDKHDIIIRLVDYKYSNNPFSVEYKYTENSPYDLPDFQEFGLEVGMERSEFETLEEAKQFFDDIIKLSLKELFKEYPQFWVD
ncbi:hypothetical protein ACFL54_09680 [Planctomycetota bacterium]